MADVSLGTGMAENARKALVSRGYRMYAEEAKANGETPLSPDEWTAKQTADKDAEKKAFEVGFNAKGR